MLHPTENNIPVVENERHILREGDDKSPFLEFSASPLYTIGVVEGPHQAMIGAIADKELRRRALYYSDSEYGEIRVYDRSGALLTTVGRPGNGPGEFSFLSRVAVTEDESRIFAWDGPTSRVHAFGWRDSTYVLEDAFYIEGNAYEGGLCATNDHLFAIGYMEESDGVIHKYSLEGVLVTSFGTRYKSSFSLLSRIMSERGMLECDEELGIIVHVNDSLPIITGYSEDGDLVWQARLEGFRPAAVEETLEDGYPGVYRRHRNPGESDRILLIRDRGSTSVIVRYYVMGDGGAQPGKWHIFRVDMNTGEGHFAGSHTFVRESPRPRLLVLDSSRVYATVYSPSPQIQVYDRSAVES